MSTIPMKLLGFGGEVAVNDVFAAHRDKLIDQSAVIKSVKDDFDNDCAVDVMRKMKSVTAEVEKCRKELKAPVLALGKAIDAAAKDFLHDLNPEVKRLSGCMNAYAMEQEKQRREAERKQREEQARLEAEKEAARKRLAEAESPTEVAEAEKVVEEKVKSVADIKSIKPAEVEKPQGLIRKVTNEIEIKDIHALYVLRPDLVQLTPKLFAIKDLVKDWKPGDDQPLPGVVVTQAVKTSVRRAN